MPPPLVILGMSGGVDSSVAAHVLIEQGFRVEGLFMANWEEDEDGYCTAAADYQDARKVAERLGIVLHTANFAAQYRERVFQNFLDEYSAGRTPNPDVLCNREIKFGVCFEHALRLGADFIATGHYARVERQPRVRLLKGMDANKDQSYFLSAVSQQALERTLFPIGDLPKSEVRRIAKSLALPVHDKKDSTGICFIGERPFEEFLSKYLPAQPGVIETTEGETLGQHRGLMYYTLGQRQGLRIGGTRNHAEQPWYVIGKDLHRNVLIVGQGQNHPALFSDALVASGVHWIAGVPPATTFRCAAKVRYRQADQTCQVIVGNADSVAVRFDQPQRAVTPGQFVVFYSGD
ncbi:MAG TPA: tRNA 2-thiouridine(34) synthase MnmA, partial [Steroidobacteraceae bacterium]|nr:tRNA 2-thiouridine(34) synthase MnmA [Steroidobacteraceae bacterium]